ncbi:L-2-hydroxyglutarate dehydrogenase, mitochondrial isoform X2 [Atheta coriaria]
MAILDKEPHLAAHQSGHNSGVIHAGIYYKPGTLKAKLCVEGMRLMYNYVEDNNIPYKKIGKLIVATHPTELDSLEALYKRGLQNSVPGLKLIESAQISSIEPNCVGIKAIWSPMTGIVDFKLVTESYAKDFVNNQGEIVLNFNVAGFRPGSDPNYPVEIYSKNKESVIQAKYVLTCGGLHSDKLAMMSGCSEFPKIVPFRGEYLIMRNVPDTKLVKGNIYPVPDARLPFLGVHFTPRMDGSIWLGPNAVLAFKREGYRWTDVNVGELADALKYSGFRKLAAKYMSAGMKEMQYSFMPSLQVKQLQRFVPTLNRDSVEKGPAGVRAQALGSDGELIDDFVFDFSGTTEIGRRILHCRNAPSPGATSSLAIARMIADKMTAQYFQK